MPDHNRGDEDAVLTPPEDLVANVSTTSPGLEASSDDAPPTEPHPVTDEAPEQGERAAEEVDPLEELLQGEPLPEFDPQYTEPLEGLVYIGNLKRTFKYLGHSFVIKTMTVGEIIETGLLVRDHAGSMAQEKAYQVSIVAGCIASVDGQPPALPITQHSDDTMMLNRFQWACDLFPPVIDKIYQEYLVLEYIVSRVLAALGEASG